MNTIAFFVIAIIAYILLGFLFKKFFYVGKFDNDNWMVFNLSIYAETFLTILYLTIGVYEGINLWTILPIWYEWIFPILWILYFAVKGLSVFMNRNNFLKFKDGEIKYHTIHEQGIFKIDSYKFTMKESDAVSFSKSGWFLELKGEDNEKKELILDLKEYNLQGFKDSIEKYFNKIELKNH